MTQEKRQQSTNQYALTQTINTLTYPKDVWPQIDRPYSKSFTLATVLRNETGSSVKCNGRGQKNVLIIVVAFCHTTFPTGQVKMFVFWWWCLVWTSVTSPPRFTNVSKKEIVYLVRKRVELPCTAQADPEPMWVFTGPECVRMLTGAVICNENRHIERRVWKSLLFMSRYEFNLTCIYVILL